jgi:uncharacterized protein (DUF58 family)
LSQAIHIQEIKELNHLDLLAAQMVEGFITGLHKSPYHGFSVEFLEHRLYNAGESTRNMDWKVFAKTDRLYVKRFEEETNLRCVLAIDNSSSMYYPEKENLKIKFSILAAAALAYLLQRQRDAFGMAVFTDKIDWQSEVKSTQSHLQKVFIRLEQLWSEGTNTPRRSSTRTSEVLHRLADAIHKRSLVILFTDMLFSEEDPKDFFAALQHLKHNKHEVLLFQTLHHPSEIEFDFEDRPYVFVDAESGEEVKVKPNVLRDTYVKNVMTYREEIKSWCNKAKIDLIAVDVTKPVDEVLLPYLIKRNKMK